MPPAVVEHEAAAVARLRQWAKDRPNMLGLLAALNGQSQELEAAFQDLITLRFIDNATDNQLDVLADIVGQQREGVSDDVLRHYVRARIKLNRTSSTPEEILEIIGLALIATNEEDPLLVINLSGAGADFWLEVHALQTPEHAAALLKFLVAARAAGVRGVLEWWESASASMFRFDSGPGLDQGHLAGGADRV